MAYTVQVLPTQHYFTHIIIYLKVFFFCLRFSLLLLEPSEIYFEDFSVFYYPAGLSEDEAVKRYIYAADY